MRMMFVGDSMTIGRAGDYTWRYRMWQRIGGSCEIVGPRAELYESSTAYADPAFPADARRHLAGWGEGWQHMAPVIRETLTAHPADVLLISLGLIDLGFYTDADETARNVHRFLTQAREANPHIRAVILPVIPNIRAETDPPFAAEVDRFNTLLAKTVADLDQPMSPLLLASRPESYDIHRDTYDGTHPNASGEHKLAGAFADAMHQAWGLGAPAPSPLRVMAGAPVSK
ncbi:GDSL-type esterase/lipase family protein [Streptomyces sp. NPDC051322]|uniref:GDSL-type esterase/lipase family protein n=1 Tax=Streptomyces sp. NPDC051322 TaxID=3154645 RepID=UPI00344D31A6